MRYSELQWRYSPMEDIRVSIAIYYTREEVHRGVPHTKPLQRVAVRVCRNPSTGLYSVHRCGSSKQRGGMRLILHANLTEFELLPLLARMEPIT